MEATLLTPDGERRIDRIAIQDKRAWILDYKTGDPSPNDEAQVKDYMQLLIAMGKEEVIGYLVYVNEKRCVEVTI